MQRFERDPQTELVRRYARILRSAPAEATRFATSRSGAASGSGQDARLRPLRTPARAARAASKT